MFPEGNTGAGYAQFLLLQNPGGATATVDAIYYAADGKTVTLLGKNSKLYAQVEAAGTIDQLVDVLRDKYHRPVPVRTC